MNAAQLKKTPPRSWLFVPALRAPEWLPKAVASGADGVVIDLEDATAPSEKGRAREVVRTLAIAPRDRPAIVVRANSDPEPLERDCAAAAEAGADGIVLPKVEGEYQITRAARFLEGTPLTILPMIETARSVLKALELVEASDRVVSLMFGAGDLAAEAGWVRTREGAELATARSLVALAAATRGIGAVDTPWLELKDLDGCRTEARAVSRMGFTGKFAIHPTHVRPIHEGFAPTADELADARGLLEAFDAAIAAGQGVATYKGRMIDRPDALQARRVVARAEPERAAP